MTYIIRQLVGGVWHDVIEYDDLATAQAALQPGQVLGAREAGDWKPL